MALMYPGPNGHQNDEIPSTSCVCAPEGRAGCRFHSLRASDPLCNRQLNRQ